MLLPNKPVKKENILPFAGGMDMPIASIVKAHRRAIKSNKKQIPNAKNTVFILFSPSGIEGFLEFFKNIVGEFVFC